MSKLLLTLLWFIPFSIVAQTKVAVYVVESSVDEGIKKIIGSEMVSAIVANKEYQAVERTPVFLEQLSKEQNVDEDQQISQIGKQIGVDDVCVVDITSFQSSYYIQARLLEVNEAVVLATAREISSLSNIDDIVSTTERIASKLIGEDAPAEYRMYRTLGGDTVGMSTVPEVIVAHHCGIKTFGISVVTDLGGFDNPVEVSHEEVQEAADKAQPLMTEIMREMIKRTA